MQTLKVGLIGFGFIGKVHAYCWNNLPYFYDPCPFKPLITRVCTSHARTAEKAASFLGNGTVPCTDFRSITEDPEIDIVDIASPNDCHREALLSAMAAGKHIYCEKPLTGSLEEALMIEQALPAYTGIAQMVLQYRFLPATLRAKQIIQSGALGDIHEFRADFLHSGSAKPETVILPWKLKGGVLADLGSHVLDLMNDLLDGTFSEVSASCYTPYKSRPDGNGGITQVPTEDNLMALVRLKNHACGTVTATKLASGSEDELRFEIHGSKGALRFNGMNPNQLFFYDNTLSDSPFGGFKGWTAIDCGQRFAKPAGFPSVKSPMGWLRAHVHCLYSFLDHVAKNEPAHPDLADGIRLEKIMEALRQSSREGHWIAL